MKEYYYLDLNKNRIGPLTLEELKSKYITANTLVWKAGLPNWVKASELPELADILGPFPPQTPPTPEQPGNPYGANGFNNHNQICPQTHLVWAILTTVLCCLPFGIVAIVKASQVERLYYEGKYEESKRASDSAKKWSIASAVASAIIGFCYFIYFFTIVLASSGF